MIGEKKSNSIGKNKPAEFIIPVNNPAVLTKECESLEGYLMRARADLNKAEQQLRERTEECLKLRNELALHKASQVSNEERAVLLETLKNIELPKESNDKDVIFSKLNDEYENLLEKLGEINYQKVALEQALQIMQKEMLHKRMLSIDKTREEERRRQSISWKLFFNNAKEKLSLGLGTLGLVGCGSLWMTIVPFASLPTAMTFSGFALLGALGFGYYFKNTLVSVGMDFFYPFEEKIALEKVLYENEYKVLIRQFIQPTDDLEVLQSDQAYLKFSALFHHVLSEFEQNMASSVREDNSTELSFEEAERLDMEWVEKSRPVLLHTLSLLRKRALSESPEAFDQEFLCKREEDICNKARQKYSSWL